MHLPDRLGLQPALAHRVLCGAVFGDVGARTGRRLGRGQPALGLIGRSAPHGPRAVCHEPVDLGRDLISVVGVVWLVDHVGGEEFPHRRPRRRSGRVCQLQPRGRADGEAEIEVETDQHPVAALAVFGQQGGQQGLALGPRRDIVGLGIEAETHVAFGHAEPQGRIAELPALRGGPVGDDIGVEQTGHGGTPGYSGNRDGGF